MNNHHFSGKDESKGKTSSVMILGEALRELPDEAKERIIKSLKDKDFIKTVPEKTTREDFFF